MPKYLVFGIIKSLHDIFTALWIGGLLTTALAFMPAIMHKRNKSNNYKTLVVQYQSHLRIITLVSIIGLWVTGLLLGKQNPAYSGFMTYSTTYETLISIKHLLIFTMIIGAIIRGYIVGPKFGQFKPIQKKVYAGLLFFNALLGIVVLFISGISTAIP